MTKHIVRLPNPDGSLLLREPNHRLNNELTSAIHAVSAKALHSDDKGGQSCAARRRGVPAPMRRRSSGAADAGSGAPHRCCEVPPAGLLVHHEISTGMPGVTCLVLGGRSAA